MIILQTTTVSRKFTRFAHYDFNNTWSLFILAAKLFRKQAIKRCFILPSHLTSASALPGETENKKFYRFTQIPYISLPAEYNTHSTRIKLFLHTRLQQTTDLAYCTLNFKEIGVYPKIRKYLLWNFIPNNNRWLGVKLRRAGPSASAAWELSVVSVGATCELSSINSVQLINWHQPVRSAAHAVRLATGRTYYTAVR